MVPIQTKLTAVHRQNLSRFQSFPTLKERFAYTIMQTSCANHSFLHRRLILHFYQWRLQDLQTRGSGVATFEAGGRPPHTSPQMNAHVGLWGRHRNSTHSSDEVSVVALFHQTSRRLRNYVAQPMKNCLIRFSQTKLIR